MHDCALGSQGGPSAPRVEHIHLLDGVDLGEDPWLFWSLCFPASLSHFPNPTTPSALASNSGEKGELGDRARFWVANGGEKQGSGES